MAQHEGRRVTTVATKRQFVRKFFADSCSCDLERRFYRVTGYRIRDRITESVHDSPAKSQRVVLFGQNTHTHHLTRPPIQTTHTAPLFTSLTTSLHFINDPLSFFFFFIHNDSNNVRFASAALLPVVQKTNIWTLAGRHGTTRHDATRSCNFMYLMTCQSFSWNIRYPMTEQKYGRSRSLFNSCCITAIDSLFRVRLRTTIFGTRLGLLWLARTSPFPLDDLLRFPS